LLLLLLLLVVVVPLLLLPGALCGAGALSLLLLRLLLAW
jgi:hypothetical protein